MGISAAPRADASVAFLGYAQRCLLSTMSTSMSVVLAALITGGSFDVFYACHDGDQHLSRAAARTTARAR
jgi:hypothetical protein